MVGHLVYDLMYRWGAPWDRVGVRQELRALLAAGRVDPGHHPRAIDLGCGTGANVVFLAEQGFRATGVDFSPVALAKASQRASDAGVSSRCRFVEADLTAPAPLVVEEPFDLLLDFGTLDDLVRGPARTEAARLVERLSRPGSVFLFWCFYARREELPRISFTGPSRLAPGIEPGEEEDLFGRAFDIEPLSRGAPPHTACFLLTRRLTPSTRTHEGTPS
jgi:SAM-dependent methyltransferase